MPDQPTCKRLVSHAASVRVGGIPSRSAVKFASLEYVPVATLRAHILAWYHVIFFPFEIANKYSDLPFSDQDPPTDLLRTNTQQVVCTFPLLFACLGRVMHPHLALCIPVRNERDRLRCRQLTFREESLAAPCMLRTRRATVPSEREWSHVAPGELRTRQHHAVQRHLSPSFASPTPPARVDLHTSATIDLGEGGHKVLLYGRCF